MWLWHLQSEIDRTDVGPQAVQVIWPHRWVWRLLPLYVFGELGQHVGSSLQAFWALPTAVSPAEQLGRSLRGKHVLSQTRPCACISPLRRSRSC